jgi:hypothetical protein
MTLVLDSQDSEYLLFLAELKPADDVLILDFQASEWLMCLVLNAVENA